jgi:hypothetical protein
MQLVARSVNGVPVRLTDERWVHITEEHCELAGLRDDVLETVAHPERIVAGGAVAQVNCSPSVRRGQESGSLRSTANSEMMDL